MTLPRGVAKLEFELWAGARSGASFTFEVSPDDAVVYTLTADDLDEDDLDEVTEGYDEVELDLSSYADDKAHVLRFGFTKDGLGDTNLSLDDVSLGVEALENAVQDLADMVRALPLTLKVERPLLAKLNAATRAFGRYRDKVGVNNLRAFTN